MATQATSRFCGRPAMRMVSWTVRPTEIVVHPPAMTDRGVGGVSGTANPSPARSITPHPEVDDTVSITPPPIPTAMARVVYAAGRTFQQPWGVTRMMDTQSAFGILLSFSVTYKPLLRGASFGHAVIHTIDQTCEFRNRISEG